MRIKSLTILLFFPVFVISQSMEKWVEHVKWDGYSHWSKYIIYSSEYMSPNSLPVPDIGNGSIDSTNHIGIESGFHFAPGDKAQHIRFVANHCLYKDLISVQLTWLPIEWYQSTDEFKINRNVYYQNFYDKHAAGDVILNTTIQLLNRWRKYQHVALRVGYRFPTSNGVGASRFTDAPGYYFDLSAARVFKNHPQWKLIAMSGFYVWQMNVYGQDDAFLVGAGTEFNNNKVRFQIYTSGYFGWRRIGDDPVITGIYLEKRMKRISVNLNLRQGLHDVEYSTIAAGIKYNFLPAKKSNIQISNYVF